MTPLNFIKRYPARTTPAVKNEYRIIPSYAPYAIRLEEIPDKVREFSIDGFTSDSENPPASNKYYLDYDLGVVWFNPYNAGSNIAIHYWGTGSIVAADDVNDLQDGITYLEDNFVIKTIGNENNIVLLNDEGGIKASEKTFNDDGTTENDIWSAGKIIQREVYGEKPSGNIDGSNITFVLLYTPIDGTERVFLNGLRLEKDEDYSLNGTTITMTYAPSVGSKIIVDYNRRYING